MKRKNDTYGPLRERFSNHKIELPDSAWQDMEDILEGRRPVPRPPAERRRRRGLFFWLLGLGLLLAGCWLAAQASLLSPYFVNEGTPALSALPIPLSGSSGQAKPPAPEEEKAALYGGRSSEGINGRISGNNGPPPGSKGPSGWQANLPGAASTAVQKHNAISAGAGRPEKEKDSLLQPPPIEEEELLFRPAFAGLDALPTLSPDLLRYTRAAELPPVQQSEPSPWQFGLRAGPVLNERQVAGLVGLFAAYRLNRRWSLELGIQHKRLSENRGGGLGLKARLADTIYTPTMAVEESYSDSVQHLDFFELPLTAHYRLTPRWSLLAGAQLTLVRNYAVRTTRVRGLDSPFLEASRARGHASPGIVRFDAGLLLGLDYRLNRRVSAGLRYLQGLYDLSYDAYFQQSDSYLNSHIQLTLNWYW